MSYVRNLITLSLSAVLQTLSYDSLRRRSLAKEILQFNFNILNDIIKDLARTTQTFLFRFLYYLFYICTNNLISLC